MTYKQRFLADMHAVYMLPAHTYDFEITLKILGALMSINGVTIKPAREIDPEQKIVDLEDMPYSFGEAINCMKSDKLDWFAYTCEAWLDLSAVISKDNANIMLLCKREGNVTLIESAPLPKAV